MPVHSIFLDAPNDALNDPPNKGQPPSPEQARAWCASLETGSVLYFPRTPVPILSEDLEFLLGQLKIDSRFHKNIAYKPARDQISGADSKALTGATMERLRAILRRYSASVAGFLTSFLAPYGQRWQLDYASCRPVEEEGRAMPLHRRNDLLHTDAFPTRPTNGRRILRFFHNIHPSRTRDWVLGEPFSAVVGKFTPERLPFPRPDGMLAKMGKRLVNATGLAMLAPQWKRTPYDEFMRRLHNAMKEDEQFQHTCWREYFQFAPGSSWMVYTDTVPHAVVAGQYALEQTLLVDPAAMVAPESAPLAVLEKMAGARLV